MPRQVNYNGVVHNFPDDTTDDEIRSALGEHELKSTAPKDEGSQPMSFGGVARSFAKQAPSGLSMLGGIAGGIPGAAAGASIGQGLKNLAPSVFGEPGSGVEQVAGAAGDTITQGVLPAVLGKVLSLGKNAIADLPFIKNLPAVKIAEVINKAKGYMTPSEAPAIESAARASRSNAPKIQTTIQVPSQSNLVTPGGQPAMINKVVDNPVYATPAGKMLSNVETSAPAFQKITPTAKEVMSDIQSVRNAKLATGRPDLVRQIAANDIVTRNFSKAGDTFNPSAILDEIGKRPDVYEEAFGKPALDSFTDLMKTAQDKGVGKTTDLMSWREGRKVLFISLPLGMVGVPHTVSAGLVLGADALKKIASNPQLGQMILQATKTNAAAPEATLLQKAIVMGLRGTSLYLKTPEGTKEKVQISQEGQVQTTR